MKFIQKFIILTIISVLSMSLITAIDIGNDKSYIHYGMDDYAGEDGIFGEGFNDALIIGRSLTSGNGIPLVANLDNKGLKEIIAPTDNGIKIFTFNGFSLIETGSWTPIGGFNSLLQIELTDIDADGKKEIIALDTLNYHIIDYDNASSFSGATYSYSSGFGGITKYSIMGCKADDCIIYYTTSGGVGTSPQYVRGTSIGSSGLIDENIIAQDLSINSKGWCLPDTRHIEIDDIDQDGEDDFIFTFVKIRPTTSATTLYIAHTRLNASNHFLGVTLMSDDVWSGMYSSGSCFSEETGKKFTSPSVYDYNGNIGNGLEVAVAEMISSNDFVLYIWDSSIGSKDVRYPTLENGEGELISNVFRADIFPDTGQVDPCVMGYNDISQEVNLLCGSSITAEWLESTRQFFYKDYNNTLGESRTDWSRTTTSVEFDTHIFEDSTRHFSPSEFVTTYGILGITIYPESGVFDGEMKVFFEPMLGEKVMIPVDYEGQGKADLIALTTSNILYIDDAFINYPPYLAGVRFNPCREDNGVDKLWDKDTNVNIIVDLTDREADFASAKVTLFPNKTYEQTSPIYVSADGWSDNQSNSVQHSFTYPQVISSTDFLVSDGFESGSLSGGHNWDGAWIASNPLSFVVNLSPPFIEGTWHFILVAGDLKRNFSIPSPELVEYANLTFAIRGQAGFPFGTECNLSLIDLTGTKPEIELVEIRTLLLDDNIYRYFSYDMTDDVTSFMSIQMSNYAGNAVCYLDDVSINITYDGYPLINEEILVEFQDVLGNYGSELFYVSVAKQGVIFDECIEEIVFEDPVFGEEQTNDSTGSPFDVNDNAIADGLNTMDDLGFRGLGGTLKWLFLMTIVAGAIFFTGAGRGYTGFQTTSMVVLIMVLMTTAGVYLKVIPVSLVIISAIIAFGLTVGLFKIFFGGSGT